MTLSRTFGTVRNAILVVAIGAGAVLLGGSNALATTAATPSVTITPSTGLSDGQAVAVSGGNFPSAVAVDTVECGFAAGATTPSCDFADVAASTSDASGAFSANLTVRAKFGDVDCTAAPGCSIVSTTTDATTPIHSDPVAISFGS